MVHWRSLARYYCFSTSLSLKASCVLIILGTTKIKASGAWLQPALESIKFNPGLRTGSSPEKGGSSCLEKAMRWQCTCSWPYGLMHKHHFHKPPKPWCCPGKPSMWNCAVASLALFDSEATTALGWPEETREGTSVIKLLLPLQTVLGLGSALQIFLSPLCAKNHPLALSWYMWAPGNRVLAFRISAPGTQSWDPCLSPCPPLALQLCKIWTPFLLRRTGVTALIRLGSRLPQTQLHLHGSGIIDIWCRNEPVPMEIYERTISFFRLLMN